MYIDMHPDNRPCQLRKFYAHLRQSDIVCVTGRAQAFRGLDTLRNFIGDDETEES